MTARPYLRTHDLALAGHISVQQVRNYEANGLIPQALATAGPERQRSCKRFIGATFPQRLRRSTSAMLSLLANVSRLSRRSLPCVH